ncbi:MAG: chromosomal replication initiator protein DnaA [Planctomycetota bacterium]
MTQPRGHDDEVPPNSLRVHSAHANSTQPHSHVLAPGVLENAVKASVGEQNYQHWFQRRSRFSISGDQLVVHVPNPFILNWMLKRFRTPLVQAARKLLGTSAGCQFEVDADLLNVLAETPVLVPGSIEQIAPRSDPGRPDQASPNSISADPGVTAQSLPVAQAVRSLQRRTPPKHTSSPGPAASLDELAGNTRRKYRTFDSFVIGECNDLAALAARQVAACPGERYNPLFIYGSTGTGKTHLLEAICSETRRVFPGRNVMYLTSEAFTNCFTAALAARTVPSFRQRFRNVDVLLIDNIEFLDNKRATQEEFLHTIVQVSDHGGQVVISADRHPKMLSKHREELTTRFVSGLVCRMEPPDPETGRKLLMSLCTASKAVFSDDALDCILRRCSRNIRELQGAVNQLESQFLLNGRRITATVVRNLLGGMEEECRRLVRISDVEKLVCEIFGVSVTDLRSPSRRKAVTIPRSIAMFLARKLTQSAYREIGNYFGGRDHSTVVAAEKRVAEQLASGSPVGLPVALSCRSLTDLLDELERRLLSAAS